MARLVIERFEDFLESYEGTLNEAKAPENAIVMVRASTSTSDVKDSLAKTLGIEKDKSYTFTTNIFSLLYNTGNNKKFDAKVLGTGTKVDKPGKDILNIGDKKITEAGEIILYKKDALKDVEITASGNGLLCLYRMSLAIIELLVKYKVSMTGWSGEVSAKDWIMKFTLGGNKKEDVSREYSFCYAYPGSLQSTANMFTRVLGMAMLENTKQGNLISRSNPDHSGFDGVVDGWYKVFIKDNKSIGETLQKYLEKVSKNLTEESILVNPSPKLNTASAEALVSNAGKYYASGVSSPLFKYKGIDTIKLKPEGLTAFKKVISDMVKAIVPVTFEGWGKEADPLIEEYKGTIESGLAQSDVNRAMEDIQKISSYGPSTSSPGSVGTGGKKFKEGGV